MKQKEIINGFAQLGKLMRALGENKDWSSFEIGVTQLEYESLQTLVNRQISFNGWFTKENVRKSLLELGKRLSVQELTKWSEGYTYVESPKTIALIMAGNIPLVGFHDFLCVLISGNNVLCKLSSDDKSLLPALGQHLIQFVPELKGRIQFKEGRIGTFDAVIATGSDNSLNYFESYFGKYPHIFRKNRTSIAVLDGSESKADIERLGEDIFSYFGLGCRNVTHLILPKGFKLERFFEGVYNNGEIINNNKYGNNYDYNKAVYLLNKHDLLDNNFVLLRESEDLFSPLAMIHYHYYANENELKEYVATHQEQLQVVVGNNYVPFGSSQCPMLDDYADGVDVMNFLTEKLT